MNLVDHLVENVDIKRELGGFKVSISGKIGCVLESVFQGKKSWTRTRTAVVLETLMCVNSKRLIFLH